MLATCLAGGLALFASTARADLQLYFAPSAGDVTSTGGEYVVRVVNNDLTEARGELELRQPYRETLAAHTPFRVAGGASAVYRIPVTNDSNGMSLAVFAKNGDAILAKGASEERSGSAQLVLFDVPPTDNERLMELRTHSVSTREHGTENAAVVHASFDGATPILTERAAAYDGDSLVLMRGATFAKLAPAERVALVDWVRAGGAIAFAPDDPGALRDLVGADVRAQHADVHDQDLPPSLLPKLVDVGGGSLRPGAFGATSPLGLGAIFVLPIDPWSAEANGNAWVQERIVMLAATRPIRNRPYGSYGQGAQQAARELDPNEGYRSAMLIAGLVLVVNAIGTAFAFRWLATRRGMGPAYRLVAGTSVVTFAAVIGLGIHSKGGFGARARELVMLEAASGEPVAWTQRYRSFFASGERKLDVAPRDPSHLLAAVNERDNVYHPALDVRGPHEFVMNDVRLKPWQEKTVAEKGTTRLPGAVTIRNEGDEAVVDNATGTALRNVVLYHPKRGCVSLGTVGSGAHATTAGASASTYCFDVFRPGWEAFDTTMRDRSPGDRLFPTDHVVLVGEADGLDPSTTDSGVKVEKRIVLLRVEGGAS